MSIDQLFHGWKAGLSEISTLLYQVNSGPSTREVVDLTGFCAVLISKASSSFNITKSYGKPKTVGHSSSYEN